MRHTIIFEPGDIVWVPFPHVERPVTVPRPALVVSHAPLGPDGLLVWTVMITNAARAGWPGDVAISDAEALGLLIPSKIRTEKIAPAQTASAALLGKLDAATLQIVLDRIRANLGL